MKEKRTKTKMVFIAEKYCVACGSCLKVCPNSAISIMRGLYAVRKDEKCFGCGKCANECPASVIEIMEVAV